MNSRTAPKRLRKCASSQSGGIRRALLLTLGALVLGVGIYGLAGFYGGPWLIDRGLAQFGAAASGRTASRETVRFNPFTLVAEIAALEMRDEEAGAAFTAEGLVVDLTARSLIELRPVVSSIVIERPQIALSSVADLSALGRHARSTELYQTRIEQLEVVAGVFAAGVGSGSAVELPRFDLSLSGLDVRSGAPGRFSLDAITAAETSIVMDGSLAASLERADGQLQLDGLGLNAVATRLGGTIDAVEPSGRVDLSAEFSATALLTTPRLQLTNAGLEISALFLTPAAGLTVTADRIAATASLLLAASEDGTKVSGRFEAGDAPLSIRDTRVLPPQSFYIDAAALLITTDADSDGLSLSLGGRLRGAGEAALTARVPPERPMGHRVSFEATDLPASMLSAYALDAVGHGLVAGTTNLRLEYTQDGNRIDGSLRIVARELAFAPETPDQAPIASGPSLELAAALLENRDHIIEIDLPLAGNTGTVRDVAALAFKARLATITETPFDALAPLMDGAAETASAVPFLPGDAALNDRALASIARLAAALNARPRLGLRVHGGYDPTVDRDALAKQQIELHVQLATAGPSLQARPAPVDFGSARARDVLDEFGGERLPAERVTALAERFDCATALAAVCERAYYELIFDALVANEEITATALNRLGRFRAQSVVDALRQQGIADGRIQIVPGSGVVETPFGVGLPVELTAAASEP